MGLTAPKVVLLLKKKIQMVFTSPPKLLCFIARLFYLRFGIVDVVAKS
jgi:hypothetical protein